MGISSYSNISSIKSQLRQGFTIVELLIVVVVIAILAAITIVSYNGITAQAEESAMKSTLRTAANKIIIYQTTEGDYPDGLGEAGVDAEQEGFIVSYVKKSEDGVYCVQARDTSTAKSFYISSETGGVEEGNCNHIAFDQPATCPEGFIAVPGNVSLGTEGGFCVMKYEAGDNGSSVPVSQAHNTPWVNIDQATAAARSADACSGCHLMTEAEWMTVAANIISVGSNWSSGSVGDGFIYSGHNDGNPDNPIAASTNDNDGYVNTGNSGDNQRRTLTLTNGEVIWDLAGGVYEWTDATIAGSQPGDSGASEYAWRDYTDITTWGNFPASSQPAIIGANIYDSDNGIGRIYSTRYSGTLTRAYARGGAWYNQGNAGVLSLYLGVAPGSPNSGIGFRVSV